VWLMREHFLIKIRGAELAEPGKGPL